MVKRIQDGQMAHSYTIERDARAELLPRKKISLNHSLQANVMRMTTPRASATLG